MPLVNSTPSISKIVKNLFQQLRVELFLYRDHIPVDDLGITAKEHDKFKFTIWYKNRNLKSYKLETREPTVRDAWVEEIRLLLWDQAKQEKGKFKLISFMFYEYVDTYFIKNYFV